MAMCLQDRRRTLPRAASAVSLVQNSVSVSCRAGGHRTYEVSGSNGCRAKQGEYFWSHRGDLI